MQQINVIVTPKAKQTISVTVNGVAMSVVNSDGSYSTTHYSGTPFIIPNITVTDSDGSTYSYPSVKDVVCTPPVGADVENSDGSYTQHINNGATLVLPDTVVKNTAGATVLVQPSATSTGVIADSVITNSDNTFSLNVPAETNPVLADIQFTDSDGSIGSVPACKDIVATPAPTPTYASARVMKTGQITSYRTGDDGDIKAGRLVDFFTLSENNVFGNTNRFTDELGGQTYANNIVIDNSTYDGYSVLGIYRIPSGNVVWDAAIDNGLAFSVGAFVSGWRLWNDAEMMNFAYRGNISDIFGYAPLLMPLGSYWSSTGIGTDAIRCGYSGTWSFGLLTIAAAQKATFVRTFSVSGTTLT